MYVVHAYKATLPVLAAYQGWHPNAVTGQSIVVEQSATITDHITLLPFFLGCSVLCCLWFGNPTL